MLAKHLLKPMSWIVAAIVIGAGCSGAPSPAIPVRGPSESIALLAGSWVGDYRLADGSRRGSITFNLATGDSSATGSVVMVPVRANAPTPDQIGRPATEQPLEVSFVRSQSGMVRGSLRPYTDPDCGCEVQTTFEGKLSGNSIEGTFTIRPVTVSTDHVTRSGRWSVTRKG
jgi:hypothetical protein